METAMSVTVTHPQPTTRTDAEVSPDRPAVGPDGTEDLHGPASFPASDPPSTWAGRDFVVR
jgi:hypothetical protein